MKVELRTEEEVLNHALGGFDKRSAYWLVYISAETLKKYQQINQNQYNRIDASYNIQLHEYGKHMKQELVNAEI